MVALILDSQERTAINGPLAAYVAAAMTSDSESTVRNLCKLRRYSKSRGWKVLHSWVNGIRIEVD